ncbi:MAG: four helix bundle protein [Prevotella sp.]|nr:four helix bundle protein [Prevotella sp.]MBQ9645087.1 four helix bundle protein [Prevotella sp.]
MKEQNVVKDKSFEFSVRIVNLYKHLTANKQEYVMSKQLLRSGTSIGANICEAEQAQSTSDFLSKISISLKESCESDYWIRLLHRTDYLSEQEFKSIVADCRELTRLLTSIIKSIKQNKGNKDS